MTKIIADNAPKNSRKFWVAWGGAILLVGGLLLLFWPGDHNLPAKISIADISYVTLEKITIDSGKLRRQYERTNADEWRVAPVAHSLPAKYFISIADYFNDLAGYIIKTSQPPNLANYGVIRPSYRLIFMDTNQRKTEIALGDYHPGQKQYIYVMKGPSANIYLVPAEAKLWLENWLRIINKELENA